MTVERDGEDQRSAFGALVAAQAPGLLRYALTLTGDPAQAEDAVSETMLRALERQDQFRGEASLQTWLHQILHHLVIDRARRHARELSVSEVEDHWRDSNYTVDPAIVAERAAERAELQDALLRLPFTHRVVVVLHDAEGWRLPEIAALLGIGLPAAKQRLRRGRMMLVSALAEGQERHMANEGVPMSCWQARGSVSDYIDGGLGSAERSLLEAHLAGCATCPPLLAGLLGVRASLGGLRDPDSVIPPQLAQRIRDLADN